MFTKENTHPKNNESCHVGFSEKWTYICAKHKIYTIKSIQTVAKHAKELKTNIDESL